MPVDETFRAFAKRWWRSKQLDLAEKTFIDYSWRLGYLERFFGRYRLSEITPRLVDRFRDELAEQAHTIRLAEQRGRPVMETATDKRGRTYERRRRPLSNTSINMLITLLGQILQQAVDYELIDRNPVRVGGRSARFLKRVRPTVRSSRSTSSTRCWMPPPSSRQRRQRTARGWGGGR